ncbi:hypothetical protein [Corynebacterium caspium]|uniref:hypothetical protein n=1 Tax=Corynebacterium caspium TaxID=234828 RepID=UPI0003770201|nr:hypothetical protein [Corynebacterium caspium]WKD59758.1 hypothetical protein CCASP_06895 [Corynebacterium caspium DSM 44850]
MTSTANRAIIPVMLSLDKGDVYTLWAPSWREHGSEWQAFLGDDSGVFVFDSPEALLHYLESGNKFDLSEHPKWAAFAQMPADRVVPAENHHFDVVGLPALLAERPSYENVSRAAAIVNITRSLATVSAADDAVVFYASHSITNNLARGFDHYSSEAGFEEWTGLGQVILSNWKKVRTALDNQVKLVEISDIPAGTTERIAKATADREAARKEAEAQRAQEAAEADPYDLSPWSAAGIDPVKIFIDGSTLYTLRTYVNGSPVFLGKFGEIFTFNSSKALVRWITEHDDHDLAKTATWENLVATANAGELFVQVHRDNTYSFRGLAEAILKGPQEVDTEQMSAAYEIMADAADWAADDSMNAFFLANPRMQDYISYMLGAPEHAGYVPTAPFSDHADAWRELEKLLMRRFSKS